MKGITNKLKKSDTCKITKTIIINFIFSQDDNDEERVMSSENYNIKTIISDEADEIIEEHSNILKHRYKTV